MDRTTGLNRTPARRQHPDRRRVVLVRRRPRQGLRSRMVLSGTSPEHDAARFAEQMRRKYPRLNTTEKRQLLTALRKALPPPPRSAGRPRRDDVTEAIELESQGMSRKEIYRRLGKATHDAQHALREAMRQRKARKRRRDNPSAVTPT